ncbi:hypothetical protein L1999_12665 [Neobacillus drentensis]|uniref:hypothetical protein n=1 Tax=Neobacillus drentensis TaxID=220684 RepID=UPI001F1EDE4C|nr:hypothetical protein [Neobacillus drentensis]ULT59322.1 hypothetical protein L1999_12665 [Neobacillus drentensis]
MIALTWEKELELEWEKASDENIVEAYVVSILNKWDQNLRSLEQELMKRKLFLVALELYDRKKRRTLLNL